MYKTTILKETNEAVFEFVYGMITLISVLLSFVSVVGFAGFVFEKMYPQLVVHVVNVNDMVVTFITGSVIVGSIMFLLVSGWLMLFVAKEFKLRVTTLREDLKNRARVYSN